MAKQGQLFHTIEAYTRNAYLVLSATRPGVAHLVDLEGFGSEGVVCTCEAFIYGGQRPCPHIISVAIQI